MTDFIVYDHEWVKQMHDELTRRSRIIQSQLETIEFLQREMRRAASYLETRGGHDIPQPRAAYVVLMDALSDSEEE